MTREYQVRFPDGKTNVYRAESLRDVIELFLNDKIFNLYAGVPEYLEFKVVASGETWRCKCSDKATRWYFERPDIDEPTVKAKVR